MQAQERGKEKPPKRPVDQRIEGMTKAYAEAVRPEMYLRPSDRDNADLLARRTEALLAALTGRPDLRDLTPEREAERARLAEFAGRK